jgi:hypothetical protein
MSIDQQSTALETSVCVCPSSSLRLSLAVTGILLLAQCVCVSTVAVVLQYNTAQRRGGGLSSKRSGNGQAVSPYVNILKPVGIL